MQSSKKRQEFAISIRRKQVSQKMQAMRANLYSHAQVKLQKYFDIVNQIQKKQKTIKQSLKQLQILSFNSEGASFIIKQAIHHRIYQYLYKQGISISHGQYNTILSILINLCVHSQLDIPNQIMNIIIESVKNPQLQMTSLWLIANIIYQKSQYSVYIAKHLIEKGQFIQFMSTRLQYKFEYEGDIVIFNFLCCSFLVISSAIEAKYIQQIFKIIQQILSHFQSKQQQNYWFLAIALEDHGAQMKSSQYQFFKTQMAKKFQWFCKTKKTKYIKHYLKMLIGCTAHDKQAYQIFLKYQIFTILDFCLENRAPQVKKLCAQIGWNLLENSGQKIDIQNVGFFSDMALELVKLQHYALDVQIYVIKYCIKFFQISIGSIVSKQSKQKFIQQIINGNPTSVISTTIINSNHNVQLISQCLYLLQIFIKIDQSGKIIQKCKSYRVPAYLQQVKTQNQLFYKQITNFLKYFDKRN